MHILIVEDNPTNLAVLTGLVVQLDGCTVEAMGDPVAAYDRALATGFDLVIADHQMPGLTGTELIEKLRSRGRYANVPMVIVTADADRSVRHQAIFAGATDFLTKPIDPVELKARVRNLLSLRRAQQDVEQRAAWLSREVAAATQDLAIRDEEIIWRLARAIEFRDGGTGEHISRVATISRILAEALSCGPAFVRTIYLASPLHDVGKIGVPDSILGKPGRLTPDEITVMQTHVTIGQRILSEGTNDLIVMAAKIVASHHEKWDGSGYPNGLKGLQIPLEGRIVAVADVFDALCNCRPYKPAWSLEEAYLEIVRGAGSHFDPSCVAAFQARWPEISKIMSEFPIAA